jgi:hypothetical protein
MNQGHQALLKEVYEKRKSVDQNQNPNNGKPLPPWLQQAKARANGGSDDKSVKRNARAAAIQKRLATKVPQQKGK